MKAFNLGIKLFLLLLLSNVTISCASTEESEINETDKITMVERMNNCHSKGKLCGVGISKPHIKGFFYQKATAISRSIDEIARQLGVEVKVKLDHYLKGSGSGGTSGLSSYSVQTTSGKTVTAQIKDTWYSKKTEELYVCMCTE